MKREIRALTGIRGIAACWVVAYHFWNSFIPQVVYIPVATPIIHRGYLAVDLFFCLSGYIMAETYSGLFRSERLSAAYGKFLARRLARIYPLYVACIIAEFVLMATDLVPRIELNFFNLAINLASLQLWSWGRATSLDGPAWSVSAECTAYVLFPLLAAWTVFGTHRRNLLAGGTALGVLGFIAFLPGLLTGVPSPGSLNLWSGATPAPVMRCVAEFTLGLLAWRGGQGARLRRVLRRPFLCESLCALILALLVIRGTDLAVAPLFAILVAFLGTEHGYIARAAGSSAPYTLGVLSYSIYLVHFPVRDALTHPLADWLSKNGVPHAWAVHIFLLLLMVGVAAVICYVGIERPGRRWLRDILERRRTYQPADSTIS
jgi:peptidoglycan/LPS O-acetylase OafA/YrhL